MRKQRVDVLLSILTNAILPDLQGAEMRVLLDFAPPRLSKDEYASRKKAQALSSADAESMVEYAIEDSDKVCTDRTPIPRLLTSRVSLDTRYQCSVILGSNNPVYSTRVRFRWIPGREDINYRMQLRELQETRDQVQTYVLGSPYHCFSHQAWYSRPLWVYQHHPTLSTNSNQ